MVVRNIFRENPASACKVDDDLSVVCIVLLTIILLYDDDDDDNDDDDDSSCPHAWQSSCLLVRSHFGLCNTCTLNMVQAVCLLWSYTCSSLLGMVVCKKASVLCRIT